MKRVRVKGTGPDRKLLKTFYKLGEVCPETIKELNSIYGDDFKSDIGTEEYSITNQIDYRKTHNADPEKYRQILLQAKEDDISDEDETSYSKWKVNEYPLGNTMGNVFTHFEKVCRFRLSEMKSHHEIIWHIDTNTSVMCRGQICLNENDSIFEFKTKDGIEQLKMLPGEIWFVNTGYLHRVVSGDVTRRVAVFSFHFDNIINKSVLLINTI